MQLFTIGHSNRTLEVFLELLKLNQIEILIDVRSIPKSRFVPWSNQINLQKSLHAENIIYHHAKELGGRRVAKTDSINLGWKNAGFRGFADYMQTKDFYIALKKLNEFVKNNRVVIMCAEAVPWRCHRSLIADAEVVRKITVCHILTANSIQEHVLTSFAVVDTHKKPIQIYYPDEKQLSLF